MNRYTKKYQELYEELEFYESRGIRIKLSGSSASPMQVASVIAESCDYMRDYILDPKGNLEEVDFQDISSAY